MICSPSSISICDMFKVTEDTETGSGRGSLHEWKTHNDNITIRNMQIVLKYFIAVVFTNIRHLLLFTNYHRRQLSHKIILNDQASGRKIAFSCFSKQRNYYEKACINTYITLRIHICIRADSGRESHHGIFQGQRIKGFHRLRRRRDDSGKKPHPQDPAGSDRPWCKCPWSAEDAECIETGHREFRKRP